MRRLLTGYTVSDNRRHKRHEQLFQNRYQSIICQEDVYFLELVRYIDLNPVRSGVLANLEEVERYPYCGHSALIGKRMREWQAIGYVLRYFGKRAGAARKAYRSNVEKGIALGKRPELTGGGLIRSLGGWDEVKKRRLSGQDRIKSDQRILGESEFAMDVRNRRSRFPGGMRSEGLAMIMTKFLARFRNDSIWRRTTSPEKGDKGIG